MTEANILYIDFNSDFFSSPSTTTNEIKISDRNKVNMR